MRRILIKLLLIIFPLTVSAQPIKVTPPKHLAANSFADIAEDVVPAVVNIATVQEVTPSSPTAVDQLLLNDLPKGPLFNDFKENLESQFRGRQTPNKKMFSIGSGFIVSKDGYIVTNNHVIDEAEEINISLNDGSKYKAKLIGVDKKTDLALLKINPTQDLRFVKFGDSRESRIGEWIMVVGNPFGLGGSISVGVISAIGRDINSGQSDEFIQTDAAINKGNSGGPIFNMKGEVIGISNMIYSPSGGSVGIGFATPSSVASPIIKQLKENGEVVRGWLGVSVQEMTDEMADAVSMNKPKGAFVTDVTPSSPADIAGILPSDIIIKFDGKEINEMKNLPKLAASTPVNKVVPVVILRQGKTKTISVKILKLKDDAVKKSETKIVTNKAGLKPKGFFLGLGVTELNNEIKKERLIEEKTKGMLVVEVDKKSEAMDRGIIAGDVILSANQTPLSSVVDFKKVVEAAKKSSKKVFLLLKRGENDFVVTLTAK